LGKSAQAFVSGFAPGIGSRFKRPPSKEHRFHAQNEIAPSASSRGAFSASDGRNAGFAPRPFASSLTLDVSDSV
jgi:hypothetical protein